MTSNRPFGILGARRKSRIPRMATVAAVALLLGAVAYARAPLSDVLWRVLSPVLALRNTLGASDAALARAELASLQAKLADRDLLYQENLELKARLGRAAGRSATVAGVLQRPPGVPYDTLVIDAGRDQGILEGSLVSMGGSTLVGTVAEVNAGSSRVTLYSAAGTVHEGILVSGGKNIPVSIAGQGGGSLRAEIPAGTGAKPGDRVLLPGIVLGFIAEVAYVQKGEGESFETIYFSLPADLNARFVEIWQ